MAWGKVDDKLHSSPKWRALRKGSRALWTTALSWSMDQLTDGHIPRHMLAALDGTAAEAAELVDIGMWESHPTDGWVFHDWTDYQPSREKVLADREAAADRQRKAREKATASRRDSRVTNGATNGVTHAPVTVPPTRPDPTRSSSVEELLPRQEHAAPPTADAAQRPERVATTNAYERTGKALKFMAVEGIAKWAIHTRGADPQTVEDAIVGIYELGKPVTKSVMGQYLDGHIGRTRTTDHARDILAAELSATRQIGASR